MTARTTPDRLQRCRQIVIRLTDDLASGRLHPEDLDEETRTRLIALLTSSPDPQTGHTPLPQPVYVVTAPDAIRGIYETWPLCDTAVRGVRGARFHKVRSRADAEAVLSREGVVLPPGVYAFIDGNACGGIGVVFVKRAPDGQTTTHDLSTTVQAVLAPRVDPQTVSDALTQLRTVLAELTACYQALTFIHPHTALTIVHNHPNIPQWITESWRMPTNRLLVQLRDACQELIRSKSLTVQFLHHPGRHAYAEFTAKADALATQAVA